jgi:hypothetical protein
LTKQRALSESAQKRMLVLRATFSLTMAVGASAFGLLGLFKEGSFWSGIFLLSVG